jgi:NAD(P)H-dependent FMN reductase
MHILAISGSRNPQGQTAAVINAILKGVTEGGGTAESIFLPALAIERCRQCDIDGYGICRQEGWCVIKDDFAAISAKIAKADAVVFATPVYYQDLSESLRAFLDRYHRTRPMRRPGLPVPEGSIPAVGICYAGRSGFGTISCAANLEKILEQCGFDVVDMIPVRRQNLEMKRQYLETVGRWLLTKPATGPMPGMPPAK